ncbi:TPA: VanZ family protein [Streptococcus agalactiae]
MLKRLLTEDGELTKISRRFVWMLVVIYCLIIVRMCFGPQIMIEGVSTPNVQRFGRIVALLVPFNSFRSLDQLTSFKEIFWVIGQNVVNILLLFPLIIGLLSLKPSLRKYKSVILLAFLMSLFIECTQVVLDILIDANRVFEIDDLWTNILGGPFALWSYRNIKGWLLTIRK